MEMNLNFRNTGKLSLIMMLTFSLIAFEVLAQEREETYPIIQVDTEVGAFFHGGKEFQSTYGSGTSLNWSAGIRFGRSDWTYLPWLKYSQYQLETDSIQPVDGEDDLRIATRRQFSAGVLYPISLGGKNFLHFKGGISYNILEEDFTRMKSQPLGFILASGYTCRASKYFSWQVELAYDYAQAEAGTAFRNWGGFILNFGLGVNFGADGSAKPKD